MLLQQVTSGVGDGSLPGWKGSHGPPSMGRDGPRPIGIDDAWLVRNLQRCSQVARIVDFHLTR